MAWSGSGNAKSFKARHHRFIMETMSSHTVDPELLEILRCPLTRSRLRSEGEFLVAEVGGLAYPVRDGIPVMLMEEAKLPAGVSTLEELKVRLKQSPSL